MGRIEAGKEKDFDGLLCLLKSALDSFHEVDSFLCRNDVSEQCICARLAYHIQQALIGTPYSNFIADCEYNRGMAKNDAALKKIDGGNVRLDIAVHVREFDEECDRYWNLMCIEMKKRSQPESEKEADRERLNKLCEKSYGFLFPLSVFILIDKNGLTVENVYSSLSEDRVNTEIEACWIKGHSAQC